MKKILIVKTSSLGDIIHAYPVVDYLHKKFPAAQIDWVVEAPYAELVQAHPAIHSAITISTKAWRKQPFKAATWKSIGAFRRQLRQNAYDVVFDLQGNVKSGLVVAQARSAHKVGFASKSVPEWPNLLFTHHRFNPKQQGNIREDYLSVVTSYFNDPLPAESGQVTLKISSPEKDKLQAILEHPVLHHRPKVLVCSGSAWRNKQLTPETLAAFLKLLQDELDCAFMFAWGSKDEYEVAQQLQKQFVDSSAVVERMSLSMLQNLMASSTLVVAMDSLPLHLAGTTLTPSFSVFGASSAEKYKPLGNRHCAFQGSCPYGRTFVKRCPILRTCPTGACIRDLQAEEIFAYFNQWWQGLRVM